MFLTTSKKKISGSSKSGSLLRLFNVSPRNDKLKWFEANAWTFFDRGFVSPAQLTNLSNKLSTPDKDRIRIAVVHHNLMPIPRDYDSPSELHEPDSNLLSNGMEVVEYLIDKKVALILHGHRHQYALTVRSQRVGTEYLTVLGAPTAGLRDQTYLGFKEALNK